MPLLLFPVENVFFFKSESIPLYVLAVTQPVALADVFKSVQLVVTEAQVVHSKVGRCPVASCCEHHVHHDLRNVELLTPWERRLLCFILSRTASSTGGPILLLLEVRSDSVLSSELFPGSFRQVVHHFTCESNAGHGIQDGFVRNHIADSQYLTVKTRFYSIHLWAFPDACSNHWGSDVYEHRSG
jgi:hypothetical protein